MINQKPIQPFKPLPPFKMWTLQNFPFIENDFDSLTNYGILCKIVEYINKTIRSNVDDIGVQNNYIIKKLSEFQNWFDNLDVQTEIDNKLDEMANNGELEEIISIYLNSTAIFGFNTVADMKSATNLTNGSFAQTLGYYQKNDEGKALYKIRNRTFDDVIDNGSLIVLNNENLVAELIFDNFINVKQFGAKGDGLTDDSTSIQNCIDYLTNITKTTTIANKNIINFPAGKYKIENQIVLSQYVKIRTTGFVAILSYVENNSAIHIAPVTAEPSDIIGNKQDWFRGPIINSDAGLIIKNMLENKEGTIGIEIGYDTNKPYSTVARFNLQEFRLMDFEIGILINRFHVYISEIRRVNFEDCLIGVQFSKELASNTDSGEKMCFVECVFAHNDISVKWLSDKFDVYFLNTSFDFNKCVFYDPNNKGFRYLDVVSCHLEGNGIEDKEDLTIPSGIVYGDMRDSYINIVNSNFFIGKIDYLFYCDPSSECHYFLTFNNNNLTFPANHNKTGKYFLATNNINVINSINNINSFDNTAKFFNENTMISNYNFDNEEIGNITYNENTPIGSFIVNKPGEISGTMEIIDGTFGNALKMRKWTIANVYVPIKTEKIPVIGGRSIITNICKNLTTTAYITIKEFDKDNNLIRTSTNWHQENSQTTKNYYMSDYIKRAVLLSKTAFVEITYSINMPTEYEDLIIYGIFVAYE